MQVTVFYYAGKFLEGVLYYAFFLMAFLLPILLASLFGKEVGTQEYGDLYLDFISHYQWVFAFPALVFGLFNMIFGDQFTTK